ncbi:MAG: hypothetical protein L0Y72_23285 [Gemmataceae bacterium]|nr:hypothetical protein [Gemmataceae bacterium]MCI0741968.1 hypothetical protein [Gemmataceae bacterium]
MLTTAAALAVCAWDPEAQAWGLPAAPLYVLGVSALALGLHQMGLSARMLAWSAALGLAAYALGWSVLARQGPRCSRIARTLRIPPRVQGWLDGWFLPSQALLAVLVLGFSVWMCLDFNSAWLRLGGPLALVLLAGACLATCYPARAHADGKNRIAVLATLTLLVVAVVEIGWALLDPQTAAPWLHRHVLLLAGLILCGSACFGIALSKSSAANPWIDGCRQISFSCFGMAAAVLGLVLIEEFLLYDPAARTTPMAWPAVALVAGLLAALVAGALWLALSLGSHLEWTARRRHACVWTAEGLVALLFVHLRLNLPDINLTYFGERWPFVMLTLGFAGIGFAHWFRKRGLDVLALPLERTGIVLPLVPLAAYLLRPLASFHALREALPGVQPLLRYLDRLSPHYGQHALLWFLVGGLFALLAVFKRSAGWSLVAALTANFGLWVIFANTEALAFLVHPQIWLVPVGVILLAAENLYRERLSDSQAQAVRYLGLLTIFLSSSADMFITGVGQSVLLPIVLALLAIAGVLLGILLRVRAFLLQGVAFLFLVVFAQIWHAAVDRGQTWVWWASGIVLGAAILSLFGLFEKRRNDVLRALKGFRQWR